MRLEADVRREYGATGDDLFWANEYELDVWIGGLSNDSAFLKPLVGEMEKHQEESLEAQREIMERIQAPTF